MSVNLLDMLKDQVSGPLGSHASKFLGESESNVSSALGGIFPSLMGSICDKGSSEEGAKGLMNMLKDTDTSILDNIGGLFGGGASSVNGLLNSGSGMLSTLLGGKVGGLVDGISSMSGMKGGSSSSLLKMALPFVMSMIGKQVKGNGLGVSGLMDLLKGQQSAVKSAMPAGLGSALGLGALGSAAMGAGKKFVSGTTDKVSDVAGATSDAGKRAVGGTVDAGKKVVGGTMDAGKKVAGGTMDAGKKVVGGVSDVAGNVGDAAVKTGGGLMKWLLPLLLVLGLGGWWMTRTGGSSGIDIVDKAAKTVSSTTEKVAGGAADLAKKGADVAGDAAGAVGNAVTGAFGAVNEAGKKALDAVKFGTGTVGSQMMDFIKSGAKGEKTFSFKNNNFATGSSVLSKEATGEVDNLYAILNAYPDVKIGIEGHTDSSGNAAANETLSQKRADSVKARLLAKGISADRVMAKGFGSAKPVASNDTAAGKAQNRRIEVKILK